jgi:hypothetical protein
MRKVKADRVYDFFHRVDKLDHDIVFRCNIADGKAEYSADGKTWVTVPESQNVEAIQPEPEVVSTCTTQISE